MRVKCPLHLLAQLDLVIEQIAGDTSGEWFLFRGVRTRDGDGLPIAATDASFHGSLAQGCRTLRPQREHAVRSARAASGISIQRVAQDIQAVGAGADIAKALGIPRRAPVLRILRCYSDGDGGFFDISLSHHPGDRFAYSMHIDVDA